MATTIGVGAEYARGSVREQLTGGKRDSTGRIFQLLLLLSLGVSLGVLAILFYDVLVEGVGVFSSRAESFLSGGLRSSAAASGVFQAIKGTFWIGVFVVVLSFPIGVASAVYLEEYASKGRFARLIDVNIRNLAGVPSIVYGILGLALFVQSMESFTGGRTLMAAGITLAILVLPIVIITAAEAIRAVPSGLKEASFGVGATKWETVRHHILPYAAPGILTGTVLSLARALGEAAPLILVGAVTNSLGSDPGLLDVGSLKDRFTAMPNVITTWAGEAQGGFKANTAAAILILMAIVLVANGAAIYFRNRFEAKRR